MNTFKSVEQITVYGANWCGDCRRSKKYLEANNITFNWIDVEKNPDEIKVMQTYNGGLQSIPTIVFPDGTVLIEPSNPALAKAVEQQ